MIVTPRWFQLPEAVMRHPVQSALKRDFLTGDSRFHVVAAGRRSFKTERMKRWCVGQSISTLDLRGFFGAPTRTQAKMIFWQDVLDLSPADAIQDVNKTDLVIRYKSGSELHVVGLDAFKRIEGVRWNWAGVSEYQEVDAQFFARTLEPILNDTHGKCILEGRPVGRNHFYDHFRRGGNPEFEEWRSYTWPSSDILSPAQIAAAKRDLAAEDYQREYEASFEAGSSRAYYAFGVENYADFGLTHGLPVIVACDFNATTKPMAWTYGQMRDSGVTYWHRALSRIHTNTLSMCAVLEDALRADGGIPPALIFYGDYAGRKNTSNSSYSDWQIIEEYFGPMTRVEKRIKPCRSVRDRVAATNALLCNSEGTRRMFVNAQGCRALIEDFERVQWKPNGVELDGSEDARTHQSDGVDYYSDYENPIRGKQTTARG